nr:G protein-coupled receptor [Proales similis]
MDSPLVHLFYSVTGPLYLIGGFCGLLGNLLVICSVLGHPELRSNPTYLLIVNQSLADLLISLVVDVGTFYGSLKGASYFEENKLFCDLIAAVCVVACSHSLISMAFLAFNRYVIIFHQKQYRKWFNPSKTLIYAALTWTLAIVSDLPNLSDFGGHVFDNKTRSCIFDRLKVGYTIMIAVGLILVPCAAIGASYLSIFIRVRERSVRTASACSIKTIRLAQSLFATFAVFSLCWVPLSLIYLIGLDDSLPASLHVIANLIAHINSALNPIIYALFNPYMAEAYVRFLSPCWPKRAAAAGIYAHSATSSI